MLGQTGSPYREPQHCLAWGLEVPSSSGTKTSQGWAVLSTPGRMDWPRTSATSVQGEPHSLKSSSKTHQKVTPGPSFTQHLCSPCQQGLDFGLLPQGTSWGWCRGQTTASMVPTFSSKALWDLQVKEWCIINIWKEKKSLNCNKIHAIFCLSLACFSSLMELNLFCSNIHVITFSGLLLSKIPEMSNSAALRKKKKSGRNLCILILIAVRDEDLIMLVSKLLHYFQTPWSRMS